MPFWDNRIGEGRISPETHPTTAHKKTELAPTKKRSNSFLGDCNNRLTRLIDGRVHNGSQSLRRASRELRSKRAGIYFLALPGTIIEPLLALCNQVYFRQGEV